MTYTLDHINEEIWKTQKINTKSNSYTNNSLFDRNIKSI